MELGVATQLERPDTTVLRNCPAFGETRNKRALSVSSDERLGDLETAEDIAGLRRLDAGYFPRAGHLQDFRLCISCRQRCGEHECEEKRFRNARRIFSVFNLRMTKNQSGLEAGENAWAMSFSVTSFIGL